MRLRTTAAVTAALSLIALALAPLTSPAAADRPDRSDRSAGHSSSAEDTFERLVTYPVFQNVPTGVDPAEETLAEISDVSEDGRTLAYTDAAGGRIGFLDLSDPSAPVGLGSHDVAGGRGGQPTSVAVVGDYALVVVDDTDGDFPHPAGRLDVVTLAAPHDLVASIDLGGQPDSIAVSPDGRYAAIAMENQRDEEAMPDTGDGEEGDLPQAPAGFVQVLSLGGDPTGWSTDRVDLPAEALGVLDTPQDAEPEYVDINDDNQLALTLQENNGVAIIDLATASLESVWSAGSATVEGVDTTEDGVIDLSGTITAPREPDAIQWVGDGLVATANEGDWKGGTRGWTVFEATDGEVVWDAGASFEELAVRHGLANEGRSDAKGTEPEGLAFDTFDGVPYAFVGSERSNFVAVYDMSDPREPELTQVLPTAIGPEGLLPIPARNLLAVSTEEDSAEDGFRATVGVYRLGDGEDDRRGQGHGQGHEDRTADGSVEFPSIVSEDESGKPIGWTALGALSGDPRDADTLWAASDAALATGRIYRVDVRRTPARITEVREVHTASGETPALDIEGLAARENGGFWAASEGATGPENQLLRLASDGEILETVKLPRDVAAGLGSQGLEGVTTVGRGWHEQVYVALQRPLAGEQTARIGRYTPLTGTWRWFHYPLESTSVEGDWIGLSEVTAVDRNTLAVIERDKQSGPDAAVKRIYTVDIPLVGKTLRKRLAHDVLPDLRATRGWTQEKLEGLAIARDGELYAVTDNDGLDDATGETVFLRLGAARRVLR
ncbi:esterase-like activity of phytase family protein [Nocardioides insulae]|uniref:esterase-like activity of phytase family protein n=1 Tax=Nocardioides insulae TaxID=394734 RepID=UPI000420C14C|nr:esterase-like activity of phytase family protein [Nocardioides insulae]